MAAVMVKSLSIFYFLFMWVRIALHAINFISAGQCVFHGRIVETCSGYMFISQSTSNRINSLDALFESINSISLFALILCWKKFHVFEFLVAILLVGHFWIWFALDVIYAVNNVYNNLVHAKGLLAVSSILEVIFCSLLACQINFIKHKILRSWIDKILDENERKWNRFLKWFFDAVLLTYVFRHLGLLLYDLALVAKNVSSPESKNWKSFLLAMAVSLRGSLAQFYFTKFFEGRNVPPVSIIFYLICLLL